MTLLWFVTGVSLVVAITAWSHARRTARRLEQLTQMYWELKYQHGELRVRLQHVSGEPPDASATPAVESRQTFVPLSSLKR
jgi:hypothetical protein